MRHITVCQLISPILDSYIRQEPDVNFIKQRSVPEIGIVGGEPECRVRKTRNAKGSCSNQAYPGVRAQRQYAHREACSTMQKHSIGRGKDQTQAMAPMNLHTFKLFQLPGSRAIAPLQSFHGILYVFSGEVFTVMKLDSLAQIKGPARIILIMLPEMSELGLETHAIRIITDQRTAYLLQQIGFESCIN
ncbi:hypothetical protein D1872_252160 [compost metagenome]